MINRIIEYSINNKMVIALFTLALIIAGVYSIKNVPVDAVPDITNNQVQIITQAPNLGTEDIEQFITYPVELAVSNLPDVEEIRSVSRFGLSVVTIVFSDKMDTYLPRQLVMEKLDEIKSKIPEGFGEPFMGPISTGLGEIYQYTLEVDSKFKNTYSITELRTIQDWIIKRQMAMVPGVVEVNAFGGGIKQYEVAIDPNELKAIDITINEVYESLRNNNQNTGGAYIEKNHQANFIRGEGLARSISDIQNIVIKNINGIPIKISDIAEVKFGNAIRYGALTKDGKGEAVGGMILMLKGANSKKVIDNIKNRIEEIQKSLPEGVSIKPFLDRSKLIDETTSTVKNNLAEGALIVIFVLVFFLGNWRGGLIVASTIPLSLLFAFVLMNIFGVWANLMSLGAIDFGIIIDGSVIIVESAVYMVVKNLKKGTVLTQKVKNEIAFKSSSKMMNTAFFGQLIILIVFLPILALEGIEGKMFIPMALTFSFAMLGAMVLCLTYVPMVTSIFINPGNTKKIFWGDKTVLWIENNYEKLLVKVLKRSKAVIISSVILFIGAIFLFSKMGGEFIPQLDEGDIAFHVLLKPGSSLSETVDATTAVEKIVKSNFPEVESIISRIGVADVPTDPMPMDIADVFVILKPSSEWVSASSKEELIDKMKAKVSMVPGINFEFTQPIEMRFNELITGVREDIAVKLYGDDLNILTEKAEEMGRIIANIDGVADMKVEATDGQPQITIKYNRSKIAQYGLQINELNKLIETSFAGGIAGTIFEGERRFDLVVRLKEDLRKDLDNVKNLFIPLPNNAKIPLKEVAEISYKPGPMQISRDNTNRRVYVGINVRGRDIKSLVNEIKQKIDVNIDFPPGYYIRYGGAFENLERATNKLKLVIPISLALIFILIFFALKSFKQTLMIYMAIPLAAIGGVIFLVMRDMPFSISAGVGFIVLFGVAVLNGLVLISGFNELKEQGVENIDDRIRMGTRRRIRPILLTALTDIFGFLPMALSTSSGAEVQRPLATVVIGGLLTATVLTLFVIPILYKWIEKRQFKVIKLSNSKMMFTALIFIMGIGQMQAQDKKTNVITIEDAVSLAIKNHPTLKANQLKVEKERVLKSTAWDFGDTNVYTAGDELNGNDPAVYTVLGIQQSNIDLFGISSKNKFANDKIKLVETDKELNKILIVKKVKSAWIRAYVTKQIYESYKNIEYVYSGLQNSIDIRYKTEAISKLEFNATKNQAKLIQFEREKAKNNYKIALLELNNWFFSEDFFEVSFKETNNLNKLVEMNEKQLNNHPYIALLDGEQNVANSAINVEKSKFLPKISAQYGIQKTGNESGLYSYQMGISIPLFFNKLKAKTKAAKIDFEITKEENQQKEAVFMKSFNLTLEKYKYLESSWLYHKKEALELAAELREGAVLSYKEGEMNYNSFIQNMKDSIQLEIDSWNIFQDYLDTKFQLEFYLSKKETDEN
ncbi:CusA/CzcA family heavy metal efflux RND transporter [Lutibacter citreus]|uniref:CusA/CzcA family heavy metal efflux RND transporter n=1 Tax=Lutibacter citreus TaxID=2138210 RepID=UPI000DBE74BA|nr:CusA/CzcA family heavy metal efflux RND transporter [Lutibacter citreus]